MCKVSLLKKICREVSIPSSINRGHTQYSFILNHFIFLNTCYRLEFFFFVNVWTEDEYVYFKNDVSPFSEEKLKKIKDLHTHIFQGELPIYKHILQFKILNYFFILIN